ncbi:fasciclin domain-containing protein [Marivita sp. GX14005]|uniref:fasciclin domain-containing protein n=1 Tax=Marivita sp. GX14005 TaxID=2942276 RepID=UPI002019F85B|nr:fasciclin domain-containing protein [Marivita sp. GX14005]MCL3881214.1 fasciclin domain-containing protein [Marivita sp. GX14005]
MRVYLVSPFKLPILCIFASVMANTALAADAVETLAADGRFDTLSRSIDAAGFGDALGDGPLTFFAPTDEAFERLPEAIAQGFENPEHADALRELLSLHLVPAGPHEADDIPVEMRTRSGDRMVVTYTRGELTVQIAPPDGTDAIEPLLQARAANEARIVFGNIAAGPGILIHGIDRVLLPPDFVERADSLQPQDREVADTGGTPDNTYVDDIAASDDGATVPLPGDTNAMEASPEKSANDPDAPVTVTVYDPKSDQPKGDKEGTREDTEPSITTLPAEPAREAANKSEPEAADMEAEPMADERSADSRDAIELTNDLVSVTTLIGKPVRRSDGTEMGQVGDLVISLSGARINALVVELDGGLFEFGEPETRRVDIRSVSIDPLDGGVILDDGAAEAQE